MTRKLRVLVVIAAILLHLLVLACTGDGTCSAQNDGSRSAGRCVNQ